MTNMPKFNPMNPGGPPPMISPEGDRMAARSRSRRWADTRIGQSDAQSAFEETVENGMENDPGMRSDFDNFSEQAGVEQEHLAGRSLCASRSRVRTGHS